MKEHAMKIRRLGRDEVNAFRCIRLEALRCEPASFASSYEDWASLSAAEWRQRLENPVIVAFQNDEPVGLIGLLREHPRKMAHRAQVVMVYVRKNWRGSGLAKKLMDAITNYAQEAGVTQLELDVSAENPIAIRFYEREGFTEIGRVPAGIVHKGRGIDDVVMVRCLSQ